MAATRTKAKGSAVLSSTSVHVTIDLHELPVEYEYDQESGDVTAFNDDLRVMAVGSTPAEAEARFHDALVFWFLEELRSGKALPSFVRDRIGETPRPPTARSRRGALTPA